MRPILQYSIVRVSDRFHLARHPDDFGLLEFRCGYELYKTYDENTIKRITRFPLTNAIHQLNKLPGNINTDYKLHLIQ